MVFAALLSAGFPAGRARGADPLPSVDAADLAQGRYASMHMLLEKTVLNIDVATIDVRFDKATQTRFTTAARSQGWSDGLGNQLAGIALGAERAVFQMRFLRSVPLNRWIGVVHDNLERAREAGLITKEVEQEVEAGLPGWFAALRDRGYEKGDRLIYAVGADTLRTMVVSPGGQTLVDRNDPGPRGRRVVLASYFAPKSEFREPLLRSLIDAAR